jgi:hypothetical protein
VALTTYEAFQRVAHRVANSETERTDLEAAFLIAFGSDEEKKRFYTESEADKQKREAKERFDAAVAAEVQRRQESVAEQDAVNAAADEAAKTPTATAVPVNPAPVA